MASSGSKSSGKKIASFSDEFAIKNMKFRALSPSKIKDINNGFNQALWINPFMYYIKIEPDTDPNIIEPHTSFLEYLLSFLHQEISSI